MTHTNFNEEGNFLPKSPGKEAQNGSKHIYLPEIGRIYPTKEICDEFDINPQTLKKFFIAELLTPLRFSPTSRKIYVAESEIKKIFKNQLPNR